MHYIRFFWFGALAIFATSCGSSGPRRGGTCESIGDSGACDGGLAEDSGIREDHCAELGCAPHQACVFGGSDAYCIEGQCVTGYEFSSVSSGCVSTSGTSCDAGSAGIGDDCESLHRSCATTPAGASCGECVDGFSLVDGHCMNAECDALGCEAEYRTCVLEPAPHCGEACVVGYVWDTDLSTCRTAWTCADLTCSDSDSCIEGASGEDARCVTSCPAGTGWDPFDSVCRTCGAGVLSPSSCNGEGETGRVWVTGNVDGTTCICETTEGYFVDNSGNRAKACDLDQDGWVTDSARSAIEGTNAYRMANARCALRTVSQVVLRNEAGQEHEESVSVQVDGVDAPLPLYETDRNDGAPSSGDLPIYDAQSNRAPPPRAVNSLTKACVSAIADFNGNAVADVGEWAGSTVGVAAALVPYYQAYTRFSYYFELHDSWYEPGTTEGDPGRLVIRERPRTTEESTRPSVPLFYDAASAYWRECQRHPDTHYANPVPSYAGADFYEFGDVWGGMLHHSEFKCVHVVSEDAYGSITAADEPQTVYLDSVTNTLFWSEGSLGYETNQCTLHLQTFESPSSPALNPIFPNFGCTDSGSDPEIGTVVWAITPYYHAADLPTGVAPSYIRGCINECSELGVEACPTYVDGAGGGFICDMSVADTFGQIQCGCDANFSGPSTSCMMGCANTGDMVQHFTSPEFAIYDREQSGYWMCLDPSLSSTALVTGTGYTLRGHVPIAVTSGTTMTGGGYSVSSRQRLEITQY